MLISAILRHPDKIQKICKNSNFEISEMLMQNLDHPEELISVLSRFKNKYDIIDGWHGNDKNGILHEEIYISDEHDQNVVAFQFIKNDKWVLHNIIIKRGGKKY
jgi:hypothetical protein